MVISFMLNLIETNTDAHAHAHEHGHGHRHDYECAHESISIIGDK